MIRTVVAAVAALALAGIGAGEAAAADAPAEAPACFGAAARDRANPCDNRALRLTVTPTPFEALLMPNGPCSATDRSGLVPVCRFGFEGPGEPAEQIVLLGDSHAVHWRAAAHVAAIARGARGISMARAGCPFTREPLDLPAKDAAECRRWNRLVVAWFKQHPEVRTVLLGNRSGLIKRPGVRITFDDRVRGRMQALRLLPKSVTKVLALRDTPARRTRTLDCIDRAMAAKRPAGTACAVPRRNVLRVDPTMSAVKRLDSPRYRKIDLSSLMCSTRLCFPVVGGALVNKDGDHMTRVFNETMGPMLLRRFDALVPRATPAG